MSYPLIHGDRLPDPHEQTQKCQKCGETVHFPANQVIATCPNPKCQERVIIANPVFTRGANA